MEKERRLMGMRMNLPKLFGSCWNVNQFPYKLFGSLWNENEMIFFYFIKKFDFFV